MGKVAKVAISLPEKVLDEVEKERKVRGESRSEFFRRAAEKVLREEQESSAIRDYTRGYREKPETPEEAGAIEQVGIPALAEDSWE